MLASSAGMKHPVAAAIVNTFAVIDAAVAATRIRLDSSSSAAAAVINSVDKNPIPP